MRRAQLASDSGLTPGTEGHPTSWTVGPYGRGQGFSAGSNGFFGYGPLAAGTWNRSNVAVYGDLELNDPDDGWTLGAAVRVENFEDFGTTTNGKVSGPGRFRARQREQRLPRAHPRPAERVQHCDRLRPGPRRSGEQRYHPVELPGGGTSRPVCLCVPKRRSTTQPEWFSIPRLFNFTADYFRIDVSDRIGITSNFTLENDEIDALLAQGVDAARDLKRFRFFTNAFATRSQGIDLVSTFTPIALRGNTVISAVFKLHRHQGDRQRPGTAQRPAAHRVCPTRCHGPGGTSASPSGWGA